MTINTDSIKKYTSIALAVLTFIMYLLWSNEQQSYKELLELNEKAEATLKTYVNKNGEQVAQIQTLQANNKKAFTEMHSKDEHIMKLQEMVEQYKGKLRSATLVTNSTHTIGNVPTVVTVNHTDTVYKDSVCYVYPTYTANWSNKWEIGLISATKDSIFRDIKISNEYEITIGKVNNGLLKKKTSEVIVKNVNPNTITEELRTFEIVQNDKRVNLSFQAGYGIGLRDMRPTPYAGFGISFNLIGIK